MFKKLKRKFIATNMLLISVVMVISFTVVYVITYTNIQNQNGLKMENIASTTLRFMEISKEQGVISAQYGSGEFIQAFGVVVNEQGEFVFDSSFGMLSKEFLLKLKERVDEQGKASGRFELEGRLFQYEFTKAVASVALDDDLNNIPKVETLYLISFLDITESQMTLIQLLVTFLVIGAITLLAILGISVYFAKRAIVPIEQSYIKQRQFIQDASHELKTPLASISANLEAVKANPKETVEMQNKWFGYISYEMDRMAKLLNDLLFLAKTENAEFTEATYPVNISEILEYALVSIETVIFEKGIELSKQIEPGVLINSDPEKIEKISKILLDNALKYSDPQGKINILLTNKKNDIMFSVSNTGEGIAKEHINHIFDRFYRVDTSRKHNGSYGLGLSIAKSLVESMNGEITVASIPNEVTTFTVLLTAHK